MTIVAFSSTAGLCDCTYLHAGHKEIGRRQSRRIAAHAYDIILMDCLASEFESPVVRELLS